MEEIELRKRRKRNMKLYPIYEMIGLDFMFYYGIRVLFLSQIKGITDADIVFASSIYAFFMIIFQVPIAIFVDKVGKRRALVTGNILNALCIFLVLVCPNLTVYIIEEIINSIAFGLKGVTESSILNSSIPDTKKKSEIFSRIHSKGYSKYCYLYATTTLVSGIIYDINPYIPIILCFITCCLASFISYRFVEIEENRNDKNVYEYMNDLKNGFKFVFKSNRLRPLLLILGAIWGLSCLFGTYEVSLLEDLNISATFIGIALAIYQIIAGKMSRQSNKFNNKYKNKSLTIILLMMTTTFLISGVVSLMNIPFGIQISIILISYTLVPIGKGFYQVLTSRYLNNFSKPDTSTKIYSGRIIVNNLARMLIGFLGTLVLTHFNIRYAMIIIAMIFFIITYILYKYAKDKLGLKPQEYKKRDLEPVK